MGQQDGVINLHVSGCPGSSIGLPLSEADA